MTIANRDNTAKKLVPSATEQKIGNDKPPGKNSEEKPLADGTRFPHVRIDPSKMTGAQAPGSSATFKVPEESPPTMSLQEMSKAVATWGNVFANVCTVYEPSRRLLKPSANALQPLNFPTPLPVPAAAQVPQAGPVADSTLTPQETKALSALQNALVGAGTKGLSLATMHAIESLFLKSPQLLAALAKKFPFIKTAAGLVPHPFIRTLGLVFPWTLEPIFTHWLRNQTGYQDPDPTGQHAPPDLAPVSTVLNWNALQPWINQMMAGRGEVAQAAVGFVGTFAINALRDFATHLATEWNKQHSTEADSASAQGPTPATPQEKTQAALASTLIRSPLELARQLQRINTENFPYSTELNKFLTEYWPGLIPAAMIYLQAHLARELAKYHQSDASSAGSAASGAASASSRPNPPDAK
jgi:hypothetical protein